MDLKELRTNKNLTLSEVSQNTGLSVSYISRLENGIATPSMKSLKILSDFYNTNVLDLYEDLESESVKKINLSDILETKDVFVYGKKLTPLQKKIIKEFAIITHNLQLEENNIEKEFVENFLYQLRSFTPILKKSIIAFTKEYNLEERKEVENNYE